MTRSSSPGTVSREEAGLVRGLLDQVLREDVGGLRSSGVLHRARAGIGHAGVRHGGPVLGFGRLRLPVRLGDPAAGDLLADLVVREPWIEIAGLRRTRGSSRLRRLPAVINALGAAWPDDDELVAGWLDLRAEAMAALTSSRLRRRREPATRAALRRRVDQEVLAAFDDHPLHPFSAARVGLRAEEMRSFAPEHLAEVAPRWVAVPRDHAEIAGELPDWWPEMSAGVAFPVHPVTPGEMLPTYARPLDRPPDAVADLRGRATLSMRTLALAGHPGTYLKLPMPMRTLGRRNLRRLSRTGLRDGALVQRLLAGVLCREPEFAARVSIADESTWLWGGDPMLAAMIRRTDDRDGPDGAEVQLPVAAMAARGVGGRPVAVELADRFWDGDLLRLFCDYLDILLGWHLRLWLDYGIVLEAHPQNVCLRVRQVQGRPWIGLLMRDLDSPCLDLATITRALPEIAPGPGDLGDSRIAAQATSGLASAELADLFVTTTLHQCVAAVAVNLARRTGVPPAELLALVPPRLAEFGRGRTEVATILAAARLPVKCPVSAATLLPKHRTGPGDVNKFYGTDAPTYLPRPEPLPVRPEAGEVTSNALLSCLIREIAIPHGRAALSGGILHLDLDAGQRLAVSATGISADVARPHGPVTLRAAGGDRVLDWSELAALLDRHLHDEAAGGTGLREQVRVSHDLIAQAGLRAGPVPDGYLASEQSLLAGHRHHPAPKARSGRRGEALEFAPEVGATFCLHHLAVATGSLWQRQTGGGESLLDKLVADDVQVPPGYVALPAHPWQLRMLRRDPATAGAFLAALASEELLDLGPGRVHWSPTASVRTLLRPDHDAFLKVSLSVRITNCVRVNPRHEIEAAVRLSDHLRPVVAELQTFSPGLEVLLEPVGRSIENPELGDLLGVLARTGLPARLSGGLPARPVLAAALAEPVPALGVAATLARITRDPDRTLSWWRRYVGLLVPPVLRAALLHGVVFEAHLQNVVLLLAPDDEVGCVVLRDLEGAKLLCGEDFPQRNEELLRMLPSAAAAHLRYSPRLGWCRAAYCLLVNHVATLIGAIVDGAHRPGAEQRSARARDELERRMWGVVTELLEGVRAELGEPAGQPLEDLLRGGPVPAKANLLTRWHDLADRDSGYVRVQLPLARR